MSKIIIVSFSFKKGGSGIAANKFRQLLSANGSCFVVDSISQDNADKLHFFKRLISYALVKLQFDGNPVKHSLNLFSYPPVIESFKVSSRAIHHFHWINNDTLNVFNFDKIPTGSVITLHDEWLYCGSEHCYKVLDNTDDFVRGYSFLKKGVYGLHWNYLIWRVKKNKLIHRNDLIYTVPSKWMLERARSSLILRNSQIHYLPNPINTETFKPATHEVIKTVRARYSIGDNDVVICFGAAIGGMKNYLKGAHFLNEALKILQSRLTQEAAGSVKLIEFGGPVAEGFLHKFPSISLGHIRDPRQLALLYSAVDCVAVPSMVESFGQVAAESLSSGTPVVCFDTSGLRDIVLHKKTGLVAEAFDPKSLADQLLKMIELPGQVRKAMGQAGREHVLAQFSYPVVSRQYFRILQDAAEIKRNSATVQRPE